MTNETTASQPKSIGDDAQFRALVNRYAKSVYSNLSTFAMNEARQAVVDYIDSRAPAAQASAEVVRNNVPGSPHNVCRTIEHNLRKRIAELEDQASATIQAAPIGMHAAADLIDAKAQKYLDDHADTENDTGALVFHYGEAGRDYHSTLVELAEELRLAATIQEPVMTPAEKSDERYRQGYSDGWKESRDAQCANSTTPAAPMVADPAGVALPVDRDAFASWTRAQQDAYCLENTGLAAVLTDHKRALAATVKAVPSEALDSDPLDTKLPCDVVIGGMTIRKGVRLGTLVGKAQRDNARLMELLPKPTPEQIAAFNALLPDQEAANFAAPLADKTGGPQ